MILIFMPVFWVWSRLLASGKHYLCTVHFLQFTYSPDFPPLYLSSLKFPLLSLIFDNLCSLTEMYKDCSTQQKKVTHANCAQTYDRLLPDFTLFVL